MKNYTARAGSTLTIDNGGERTTIDLYSKEGLDFLSNLWIKSAAQHRLMYEPTWLGRPIIQFPTDIVAIQELLWKLQPDVVVETGVAHGGSLVLSASILELIGKGKVIGVDIEIRPHNRVAIEEHPLKHRIELIEGSSVAAETLVAVRKAIGSAKSVLVFLDSNHTEAHVLQELELYGALVTPGSYLVAHDGSQAWVWDIPRGKPEWKNDHPLNAIHKFLAAHSEFRIDPHWTRHGITSSPDGFLKRVTETEIAGGAA
ncbi:MAG: class I SAM-dependent methyltransferase [Deltaproteobacteria bacterium]|nr:class I SAM-dependent methyltransferase [Deltaproteobacteria bacterium]